MFDSNLKIIDKLDKLESKINTYAKNQNNITNLCIKNNTLIAKNFLDIDKKIQEIKYANKYNFFNKKENNDIYKQANLIINNISDLLIDIHELSK